MRRKEGNKEKDIMNASIKIFAKNGYHEATVAKIATTAKVGTGSIYLYFESKRDILHRIFEILWSKLAGGMTAINEENNSTYDKISNLVDLIFDTFIANHHLSLLYVKEQESLLEDKKAAFIVHYKKFYQEIENLILKAQKKNEIFPQVEVNVLKHFIIGGIRSLILEYSKAPKTMDIETMKKGVLFFFQNSTTEYAKL